MDPMFTVGILNLPYAPPSFRASPMTGIRIGLSQTLPWPGKRGLQEDAVRLGAEVMNASADERANQLAAQVRNLFYEVHFMDVAIEVINKNLTVVDALVQAADSKYRVGRGMQQDSLKARVVQAKLKEQRTDLTRRRRAAEISLGRLMASDEPVKVPSLLNVAVTQLPELSQSGLLQRAQTERPLLRQLHKAIEAAQQRASYAQKAALPDLTVGFAYTVRVVDPARDPLNGADFLSLTAGVNLPVWYGTKQGPLAQAAALDVIAAERDLESAQLEVTQRVESIIVQLPELLDQMEAYRTSIIPMTQQTLEADLIAYQVDKVDILDLLEIEMKLLNYEVDYHRLHVEREKLVVQLAEAVGVDPANLTRNQ